MSSATSPSVRSRRVRSVVVAGCFIATFLAGLILGLRLEGQGATTDTLQTAAELLAALAVFLTLAFQWWSVRAQLEAQRLQSVFFPYLKAFQTYVDTIECGALRGHQVFVDWARVVTGHEGLKQLLRVHESEVHHYVKQSRSCSVCCYESSVSEAQKDEYLALLRAHIFTSELVLIKEFSRSRDGDSLTEAIRPFRELGNATFLVEATGVGRTTTAPRAVETDAP